MNVDAQRAYLKKENVLEHLEKVVNRVISEKPQDAYALVEVISRMIKEPPLASTEVQTDEQVEALGEYVQKLRKLDKVPAEEDAVTAVCAIPDIMEEAEMFAWAGVGFGELESYRIKCSLRNLAAKEKEGGLNKLRFWGKILGTDADYYVAEAQKDGGGDEDEDPDKEPAGTGVNVFTYFVTTDLTGDWRKLPELKPKQIIASTMIKRLVSGDPDKKVITHPFFDGTEGVYLRCLIARITADTTICIKGKLIREDEEDPASAIVENPEFMAPMPSELVKPEAWTHMQPHILKIGRTTYKEVDEEDEAAVAKMKEMTESDPQRELLRNLAEDKLEWSIKQVGDTCLYKQLQQIPEKPVVPWRCNAVTCVRSLTWPGAVTVAKGQLFASIYVGYGLPTGAPDFFIRAPLDVQEEPEDPGEVPEPNGSDEQPAEAADE